MRLTLRQLQIFLAVAQEGSTTAASNAVALSQSATSASLNELEMLLGIQLFDRVGKRLLLNDNGRLMLSQARQILDAAMTIEQQFMTSMASTGGGMRIGASSTIGSYLLPTMLASSIHRDADSYPRITIANTADITTAVSNFEVDIGLIEGPSHRSDLEVEPWIRDELIIVAAPTHALVVSKSAGKVSLKSLRGAGWLMREAGSGTREAVEYALLPHLHSVRTVCEFSNSEAIKYAAAEGLGLACLSRCVVKDIIEMGRLVEVKTVLPELNRQFYLVRSRYKILSPRLLHFHKFCQEWTR
ncbi:LysR family transcriptional regulator [Glaciimonas sp. CA11.2]|uniref:LysR family transcriptional regulator n=1 Tax=unclassified Glaciimonas TaxID=2644401 RepID=UPI002AB34F17|nr:MULTISPECIES: LysR family transcriptional regulator [unclassified Glaciimonas]MDY7546513.1 LysR family transcriptional regulator [Glaciimonas sp. CA11.2]MEB0012904.1 LysR family transcriptional regulator [Glaciimonas sp. Cout2]MEB0080805.1 LysR family transcriptional regulator [Glaciimonas sp. Gout2]MEB0162975.1 LysR family transcriptional regulator [Glaciimonas sp. CA11.2]